MDEFIYKSNVKALIKALMQKDIYKYFNNDWETIEKFLTNNCNVYDGIMSCPLSNWILQRLIPYIEPNINTYEFLCIFMGSRLNKKNFFHYIYPFKKDFNFPFFYYRYLTDKEKADYVLERISDIKYFYLTNLEIVIENIKDKQLKENVEMMLKLRGF